MPNDLPYSISNLEFNHLFGTMSGKRVHSMAPYDNSIEMY